MIRLIKKADSKIVSELKFDENAAFFKDALAFYDAYSQLSNRSRSELPNFCFSGDNKLLLDGMCLLIKELAAEFPFASLHLSVDYLKILYYYIASLSGTGEFPERKVIEDRFSKYSEFMADEYKKCALQSETASHVGGESEETSEAPAASEKKSDAAHSSRGAVISLFVAAAIVMVLYGVMVGLHVSSKIGIPSIAVHLSLPLLAAALAVTAIVLATCSRSRNFQKVTERKTLVEKKAAPKFPVVPAKLASEYYETQSKFETDFSGLGFSRLKEQLAEITQNKVLSYNLKHDIKVFEEKYDAEIAEEITKLSAPDCNFSDEYKNICSKPHLIGSKLIRFSLICELLSRRGHAWTLTGGENPFGVDLKKLCSESVGYVGDDNLIYTLPLDYVSGSSVFKSMTKSNAQSAEELYTQKYNLACHFVDTVKSGDANNKAFHKGNKPLTEDMLKNIIAFSRIPTLPMMKQKLAAFHFGLENSNRKEIEVIMKEIIKNENETPDEDDDDIIPELIIDEFNYVPFEDELDKIIDIDEISAKCVYGDKDIIGYKVD